MDQNNTNILLTEERFRLLAENAGFLFYRFRLFPTIGFEYVSPSSTAITGYTPEEYLADPEIIKKMTYPGDRSLWPDLGENPAQLAKQHMLRWIRKDGCVIWIEHTNISIQDNNSRIIAVEGIVRDITESKKIEEELEASRRLQERLLNNPLTPIMIINTDTSIRYANPAFEKLTGFFLHELVGQKPPYPYWPHGMIERYLEVFQEALQRHFNRKTEKLFQAKNGNYLWVETLGVSITDIQGNIDGYQITWIDVTERKLYEADLIESEAFNSILLDNTPHPIVVTDRDSSVIFVNQALENLTGYISKEIIGRKAPYPWWPPDNTESYSRKMSGSILDVRNEKECCFCKKNGDEFWVEMTINPVMDQGKARFYISNWVDISERKRSERALQDSEKKYRNLVDNVKLGIFRSTPGAKGRFLDINHGMEKITGYSREELLDMDVCNLYANPQERVEVSLKTLSCRNSYSRELNYRKKNGDLITVSGTFFPVKNNKGEITYFDGILEDVTERRLIEIKALENETFKQLDMAKNELLANVSHELRTPLASIKGFIETLIEPDVKWSRKKQLEFLNEANRQADHLMLIIRDLLDMSRIEAGKLSLNRRNCRFEDILELSQPRMNILTAYHNLRLIIDPGLPSLCLDPDRIAQVITNLVENAAKFSPDGTEITLEAKADGNNLIVSIRDQGKGMTPEIKKKLFNRFFQAQRVVEGKTRGTGLGLAICKGIITAHEGRIWVQSQAGQGSTFSFSIPLRKPAK